MALALCQCRLDKCGHYFHELDELLVLLTYKDCFGDHTLQNQIQLWIQKSRGIQIYLMTMNKKTIKQLTTFANNS